MLSMKRPGDAQTIRASLLGGMMNLDMDFIAEYAPLYVEAAKLTLRLGLTGILLSLAVGLLCSLILCYRVPVLRQITAVYIELSRNTPLLVQLFFLYFGLPKAGIRISSESCAVIGLTFLGGSFPERTGDD